MQIEIAKHVKMSESGKSLLRLIQNNDISRLDLLVRESVQNSLDAGDRIDGHKSVNVDFTVGTVKTESISGYFEGIEDRLNSGFPGMHKYLAIRDSNTTGLTGPVSYSDMKNDDNYGNLLKLVYEISKPQDQDGSGGSWGLGKTVYFRIGTGLVLYYSRIAGSRTGEYSSRLAAALVEDEKKATSLLPKRRLPRGIAWWGQADPADSSQTMPVTDEREIREMLDSFGISPYSGSETGTMIIIPFVDEKKLLKETEPESGENSTVPYWCRSSLEDYLYIAAQRWYAPRIDNPKYQYGQYLRFSVNGKEVTYSRMAPVFQLVQKLYNCQADSADESFNGNPIKSVEIRLNKIFSSSTSSGTLSYVKVFASDMKMQNPENLASPYLYINKSNDALNNLPIMMFTRKPGMIVAYDVEGEWTNGMPFTNKEEFIVGLFKANSENTITDLNMSLNEYLRKGEKADHKAWDDWSDINQSGFHTRIVNRIQKHVIKEIRENYATITNSNGDYRNVGLGKMLADILLPEDDIAGWDSGSGGSSGAGGTGGDGGSAGSGGGSSGGGSSPNRILIKQIGPVKYSLEGNEIEIQLFFGKNDYARLEMLVQSEGGLIPSSRWEEEIATAFPISINKMRISRITKGRGKRMVELYSGSITLHRSQSIQYGEIRFEKSERFAVNSGISITVPEKAYYMIEMTVNYTADHVRGTVDLRKERK
jgi:uncharacterized membrane protein YgcG